MALKLPTKERVTSFIGRLYNLAGTSIILAFQLFVFDFGVAVARFFGLTAAFKQLEVLLQRVLGLPIFVGKYKLHAKGPNGETDVHYSAGNSVLSTNFHLPKDDYIHFPFTQDDEALSDAKRGHLAMMASKLCYENPLLIRDVITYDWGYQWLADQRAGHAGAEVPDTYWYAIHNRDAVIVTFRGTEPLSLVDVATDFDLSPAKHDGMGSVHEGFYKALLGPSDSKKTTAEQRDGTDVASKNTVFDAVIAALNKDQVKDKDVYLAGHSLGAALAVVFAQALLRPDPRFDPIRARVKGILTGGQPRVGDLKFVEIYTKAYKDISRRYVHASDIVPKVPPTNVGFVTLGSLRFMPSFNFAGQPRVVSDDEGEAADDLQAREDHWALPLSPVKWLISPFPPAEPRLRMLTRFLLLLLPGLSDHLQDNYERVARERVEQLQAEALHQKKSP